MRLQNIDRRILYLLLAAVITVPLVVRPSRHPSVVFPEVSSAHGTLAHIPKGKIVIVSTVWSAGTEAENQPQTEVIIRHLFKTRTPFVVVSWDPVGTGLTYDLAADLAKKMRRRYGTDWVHLGYNPGPIYAVISGMGKGFQQTFKVDRFRKRLSDIPCTKNVRDHRDIGAVVEITPSGTLETWIAYFSTQYRVPLVFCPTAVMAAEAYKFLDSKQIAGMLNGVIGAAQYETLLGMADEKTDAAAASWALSAAHMLIILLIVLGNVGHFMSKRTPGGRTS